MVTQRQFWQHNRDVIRELWWEGYYLLPTCHLYYTEDEFSTVFHTDTYEHSIETTYSNFWEMRQTIHAQIEKLFLPADCLINELTNPPFISELRLDTITRRLEPFLTEKREKEQWVPVIWWEITQTYYRYLLRPYKEHLHIPFDFGAVCHQLYAQLRNNQ